MNGAGSVGTRMRLAKRRPPPRIRKEVDIGYCLSGQSVELLEIRPQGDDPSIIHRRPFAKATANL